LWRPIRLRAIFGLSGLALTTSFFRLYEIASAAAALILFLSLSLPLLFSALILAHWYVWHLLDIPFISYLSILYSFYSVVLQSCFLHSSAAASIAIQGVAFQVGAFTFIYIHSFILLLLLLLSFRLTFLSGASCPGNKCPES
jgi:hypothetical protein